jgi:ElaB/YqjD/DUF883 family membrane-anchored ribosome-binding protein
MSMNGNGQRSPDEIQADIERTRAHLNETLSAIEQKLTPSQLIDQGFDYLRHSGAREYVSNLGESAKQEPIPLALVGIGLAWLMLSNGRSPGTARTRGTVDEVSGRAREMASSVADSARSTMDSVRDKMSSAADSVRSTFSGLRDSASRTSQRISESTHAARERASQVSATARDGAVRMREGYDRLVHDHPLALGALGLAVGALLAAGAPRTRQEDRLMGDTSERMKETMRERTLETYDRAASSLGAGPDRHDGGSLTPETHPSDIYPPAGGIGAPDRNSSMH